LVNAPFVANRKHPAAIVLPDPRPSAWQSAWQAGRAPFIALVVALISELLRDTPFPNPAPVMLVLVVFATYNWRLRDGVLCGLVAVSYALVYYSEPDQLFRYSPESLGALISYIVAAAGLMSVLARSKKRIEHALEAQQKARHELDAILESISDGFIAIDSNWCFTFVNTEGEKLLGRVRAQMIGRSIWEVVPNMKGSTFHENYRRAMEDRVPVMFEEHSLMVDKWFEVHAYPAENGISVYFRDVTENRRAQEALKTSEERYRELFENANDLLYIHDLVGNFTSVNHACVTLTGYTHAELQDMNLSDLIAPEHLDHARQMLLQELQQGGGALTYEVDIIARDGARIPVEVSTRLMSENGRAVAVQGIARDISERKRAEEALRNMSLTDPLTSVYNRRGALTLVDQQLKVAQRLGRTMLLLYADVNQLKYINDTFGHTAGDAALVEIAHVLQQTFRDSDIIARMGGDEFVIVAMETAGSTEETLRRRLTVALDERNRARPGTHPLSVSLGVARFDPLHPRSFEDLVAEADERMYAEKRKQASLRS